MRLGDEVRAVKWTVWGLGRFENDFSRWATSLESVSCSSSSSLRGGNTYDGGLAAVEEDDMADCWLAIGHSLHTDKQV